MANVLAVLVAAVAADYAIAVEGADIKLSELAVGIGPVGPAVERKNRCRCSAHWQLTVLLAQ